MNSTNLCLPKSQQNFRIHTESKEDRNQFNLFGGEHVAWKTTKSSEINEQFRNSYQNNLDQVMYKNPEYFKHVAGKCVCFKTCRQQRCQGNDQNQYKLAMPFSSTYSSDFTKFNQINQKDAQIQCDPHFSQYYDQGTSNKIEIEKESVAQFEFNDKIFPKLSLSASRKNNDRPFVEPMLNLKTQYKTQFKWGGIIPAMHYDPSLKNQLHLQKGIKLQGESIYQSSFPDQFSHFVPTIKHQKSMTNLNAPFYGVSTTKASFTPATARIKEIERPLFFRNKPQKLPIYKQQFLSITKDSLGRTIKMKNLADRLNSQSQDLNEFAEIRKKLGKID